MYNMHAAVSVNCSMHVAFKVQEYAHNHLGTKASMQCMLQAQCSCSTSSSICLLAVHWQGLAFSSRNSPHTVNAAPHSAWSTVAMKKLLLLPIMDTCHRLQGRGDAQLGKGYAQERPKLVDLALIQLELLQREMQDLKLPTLVDVNHMHPLQGCVPHDCIHSFSHAACCLLPATYRVAALAGFSTCGVSGSPMLPCSRP